MLYTLHRLGWLRASTVVMAGAFGGVLVAAWFAFEQRGAFIRAAMPMPGAVALGALVGGACWWVGRGGTKPNEPAT